MSRASVLIWLGVAVALAVITAYVAMPRGGGAVSRQRLMPFEPSQVEFVRVEAPGQGPQAVRRIGGGWEVVWDGAEGGGAWRADEMRVNSALRVLAMLEGDVVSGKGEGGGAATVTIGMAGGGAWVLEFGAAPLTGSIETRVTAPGGEGTLALVGSDVHDMLVRTGLLAWRDARLLPGLGADVSRITLETQGRGERVVLAKMGGRWQVREPWQATGDEHAVAGLVRRLAGVVVTRFVTGSERAAGARALESPIATLVVESDVRRLINGEYRWEVSRRVVRLGGLADLAERHLYAGVEESEGRRGDGGGMIVVVVPREALDAISMDPGVYTSRLAVDVPGTEWGAVEVVGRSGRMVRFERRMDGWMVVGDEDIMALDEAGRQVLQRVMSLLGSRAADRVTGAQEAGEAMLTVRVLSIGGGEIALLRVIARDGAAGLATGGVIRWYEGAESTVASLAGMLGRE